MRYAVTPRDSYQQGFTEWMQTQQVGCGFARSFAKKPEEVGLQGVTILGKAFEADDLEPINVLLDQACAKLEGVYLIFPDVNSLEEIIGLIVSLCGTLKWRCVEVNVDPPAMKETLLIGLRWYLPDQRHMNYVLGFANLPAMPRTRRAPYTTLMIRTGPPGRAPGIAYAHGAHPKEDLRHSEPPPVPVHLADMPDFLATAEAVARLWKQTTKLKRNELEGDPMAAAAKAKVTFCLPTTARDSLIRVITDTIALDSASAMA